MIISRAPLRISFGGGGTDLESYYSKYTGLVVSTSINKYFYAILTPRDDKKIQIISSDFRAMQTVESFNELQPHEGFEIPIAVIKHLKVVSGFDLFTASEIPPGTGLGSSGAVAVSLVNLFSYFKGEELTKQQLAETAYFVGKHILNFPIGKQDEYASAFGGLNFIEFKKDGVTVQPLQIREDVRSELENNIMLFSTEKMRKSSKILSRQDKRTKQQNKMVINALNEVKKDALNMKSVLESGNLNAFGELLNRTWTNKKMFDKNISDERIDYIYDLAIENGAQGGKITGAGGGGYFMFYCEKARQNKLRERLKSEGLKEMDFKFDIHGATIFDVGG